MLVSITTITDVMKQLFEKIMATTTYRVHMFKTEQWIYVTYVVRLHIVGVAAFGEYNMCGIGGLPIRGRASAPEGTANETLHDH
jgi:hypothetical protein